MMLQYEYGFRVKLGEKLKRSDSEPPFLSKFHRCKFFYDLHLYIFCDMYYKGMECA